MFIKDSYFFGYMNFSKTELFVFREIALGCNSIVLLSQKINLTKSQLYKIIANLRKKEILSQKNIVLKKKTHVQLLARILIEHEQLISFLSNSGLSLLLCILSEKKLNEILERVSIQRSTFFEKYSEAKKFNLIDKNSKGYVFHKILWVDLHTCLEEISLYENTIDSRVPSGSQILYKTKDEILFISPVTCDAQLSSFSAFVQYGIPIRTIQKVYYLPFKKLSKKEILTHALIQTEKQFSIQNIIFVALFYSQFKSEFPKDFHKIIINIHKVLENARILGYPTRQEIVERAKVYDIDI